MPALQGVFSSVTEQPPEAVLLPKGGLPQGEQNGRASQVAEQRAKSPLLSGTGKRREGAGVAESESGLLAKAGRGACRETAVWAIAIR